MNTNDGGPAFPTVGWEVTPDGERVSVTDKPGMSLRDYFAASAVTGFIAGGRSIGCAADAYAVADAMLEERKKVPQ